MLDKKTEAMLQVANALTADDLDCLRSTAAVATVEPPDEESEMAAPTAQEAMSATGTRSISSDGKRKRLILEPVAAAHDGPGETCGILKAVAMGSPDVDLCNTVVFGTVENKGTGG